MAVGVVEGYPWWWRGMRPANPVHTNSFMGKAKALSGGRYLLTIPGYAKDGRFVAVQFSTDGVTWSPEEPYKIEHEVVVEDSGVTSIRARLLLSTVEGRTWTKPVTISLQ